MDALVPTRLPIFVVFLLLAGLLLAAGAAHGATTEPAGNPLPVEEPFEGGFEEEDEGEEGECEEAEDEFEEGELTQAEVDEICEEEDEERRKKTKNAGPNAPAPEECVLRSAHASAITPGKGDKLKLTIGYTTYEPVAAELAIGRLATLHRHLGHSGVIRIVENLHGDDAPKQLSVRIDIPSVKRAGCPSRRLVLFPR
jgi:hypothetical protein